MHLGEKLKLARQEAGLSQRQLCGDVITRNMLSQIEHGTAQPSIDTLKQLASRLRKPVSFFLEEDTALSPNQALIAQAKQLLSAKDLAGARQLLKLFQQPDPVLEGEWKYLSFQTALASAQLALAEDKPLYARQLLEETTQWNCPVPDLARQRILLLGRLPGADLQVLAGQLPSLDEELLLRAGAALAHGDSGRALALLEAVENEDEPRRNLLLGRVYIQRKELSSAAKALQKAEDAFPGQCYPLLEECFRELGDFRLAYEYACKQR